MGRCINAWIEKPSGRNFTEKEKKTLHQIAKAFPEYSELSPYFYYPYWVNYGGLGKSWEHVEDVLKVYIEEKGMDEVSALKRMEKEKFISFKNKGTKIFFFHKTQGNEAWVDEFFHFFLEVSRKLKSLRIRLSDEGEYLLCDQFLQGGLVFPDIESVQNNITHYVSQMALSKEFEGNYLSMIGIKKEDFGQVGSDLGIGNGYGTVNLETLKLRFKNLKEIEKICAKHPEFSRKGTYFCLHNLNNLKGDYRNWFSPHSFHRKINHDDFKDWETNPGTLMSGFDGEYWGLSDKDSELESYKAIANIQKLLGEHSENLKVLGE